MKRQQEEKEAALKAEQERLEAEKAEKEKETTCNIPTINIEAGDTAIDEGNESEGNENNSPIKEFSREQEETVTTNQISNTTVIESQSTESIKQVANGQQINSHNPEASVSDNASQPQI